MKYRLLALDVDDTLVGRDKTISPANLRAVRRAQEAGIYVTIITGRGYFGSSMVWKELGVQGYLGVYGGAAIMDSRTDTPVMQAMLEPEVVTAALAFAHENGMHIQLYQNDTVLFEKESDFTRRYVSIFHLPHAVVPDIRQRQWHNVPKMLAAVEPGTEEEAAKRWQDRFAAQLGVHRSMPGYIELNRKGTHKGSALCWIAAQMGIPLEQTIAMGDNTLDLEMVQAAGLGVCVENANEQMKRTAQVIAPHCERDAVAWVIDHYMLGE